MRLSEHPTVRAYKAAKIKAQRLRAIPGSDQLRAMALDAGADDVGLVDLQRTSLAPYRNALIDIMPTAESVMVLAFRINRIQLRTTAHSVADHEFKQAWTDAGHISRKLVTAMSQLGINAMSMPAGFPQEASRWPGKMWLTNEKKFAIEAGLGHMGYNRLLLHPKFGAAVVLGSILLSAGFDHYDQPLDYNPCFQCGLCLKACPVGAVKKTDDFDFTACYSHNYRERLGGFQDWVEQIVNSKNHVDYRKRVSDAETISMWQNLSIGSQTRCDRCMAVCPAGEDAIGEYMDDRKAYIQKTVKIFGKLPETVYVVKGSDAEQHVRLHFPSKQPKIISNGVRPSSATVFLSSLPLIFQPGQAKGLEATYHFTFFGEENLTGTVAIREQLLEVNEGLVGIPDLHVSADSRTWVRFLSKEVGLVKALLTRKIKIKGNPNLMMAFAKCFPA